MSLEGFFVIAVILLVGIFAGRIFWPKIRIEPIGPVTRTNEFQDDKLRHAARRAAEHAEVTTMPREIAQQHISELARHAVAKEYASMHRGLEVKVTEYWPDVVCIIDGNIAMLEIWVGDTLDREGIRPVRAEVKRHATLKLHPNGPIKASFEDMRAPPPKLAPKPAQQATEARPEPKRRTLPRKG